MTSTLELRNIVVNGHRTSVRLEPDMWAALEEIARREHCTINRLCSMVERQRRQSTLTAAIRVFALTYFRGLAGADGDMLLRDEASRLLAEAWRPHAAWRAASRAGDDFEEKTLWSEAVLYTSRTSGFFRLFHVWTELHALRGAVPSAADLAEHGLAAETEAGNVSVIDVTAENPANFRLLRTNDGAIRFFRGDFTNQPISRLPSRLHADSFQLDLNRIKMDARPALYLVDEQFSGARRAYLRLVLPVSDAPGRITTLVSIGRGKNTEPSIYDEPIFGRRRPSLWQIRDGLDAAPPCPRKLAS